ncbi:MAG: DUF371 domain-containing protein [Candidatus Thorarchaeota archaeon]|nr:DUF371 domain-containing protein [Candidatus Thorarchaeota archaeon]
MDMRRVSFRAYGHDNVIGNHRTTVELTSEEFLTPKGTCIIGIRSDMTLNTLDDDIKKLALSENTKIILRLTAGDFSEEIVGHGSPGLTYVDGISMVARTSTYECGRTLMIRADKAASDLSRELVNQMQKPDMPIDCELIFITE